MKIILSCFLLVGCSMVDVPYTPQQSSLSPSSLKSITEAVLDFENTEEEEIAETSESGENIDPKFYKKISITVSRSMKIRDVFMHMGKLAEVNVFVIPEIDGGIYFEAKNRPFIDILNDICSSCFLKYTIKGDSVKIENDSPMTKVYNLQFLNIQRETQSSVSISTDIFMNKAISNGDSAASSGDNNGSNSIISGVIKNDFWTEVEQNLKHIVGEDGSISIHRQGRFKLRSLSKRKCRNIYTY